MTLQQVVIELRSSLASNQSSGFEISGDAKATLFDARAYDLDDHSVHSDFLRFFPNTQVFTELVGSKFKTTIKTQFFPVMFESSNKLESMLMAKYLAISTISEDVRNAAISTETTALSCDEALYSDEHATVGDGPVKVSPVNRLSELGMSVGYTFTKLTEQTFACDAYYEGFHVRARACGKSKAKTAAAYLMLRCAGTSKTVVTSTSVTKVFCSVCNLLVRAEGHSERCRTSSSVKVDRTQATLGDTFFRTTVLSLLSRIGVPNLTVAAAIFVDRRWQSACYGSYFGVSSGSSHSVADKFEVQYIHCDSFRSYVDCLILSSVIRST